MLADPEALIRYTWAAVGLYWLAASFWAKRTVRRQPWQSRIVDLTLTVAGFWLLLAQPVRLGPLAWRILPASPAIEWLGFALTLAGAIISIWARLTIGANWSSAVTIKEQHELVRSGPYAVVRHPIYSGLLLSVLGTAVAGGELRGALALLLLVIGLRLKSLREEAFMVEQFGTQYADYRRSVSALVPFVY